MFVKAVPEQKSIFGFLFTFLKGQTLLITHHNQGRPHIWGHGEMSSPCFRPFSAENYIVWTQQFAALKLFSACVLAMF